jgi:hypothetical protein
LGDRRFDSSPEEISIVILNDVIDS